MIIAAETSISNEISGIAQFKLPLPKNANPEQLINHKIIRFAGALISLEAHCGRLCPALPPQ